MRAPKPLTEEDAARAEANARRVVLTKASEIAPRKVFWLWDSRIALGTLSLLAGREGLGKSVLAYTIVAAITRGTLKGAHFGEPRSALICATEDSWSQTIVPRLMAAGADLDLVFRVEVKEDDQFAWLHLPRDIERVKAEAVAVAAVILLLDPLISRLDPHLDSHKDSEVRQALEPMVSMADDIKISILGLIHHNKSVTTDPLQVIMASRAFPAVARSVHTVIPDPEDDTHQRKLFGTPKNNLGRVDLPTLSYTLDSVMIETADGPDSQPRLNWGAESMVDIHEHIRRASETPDNKSAADEAAEWLLVYLAEHGNRDEAARIKSAARREHISDWALRRARERLKIRIDPVGFPAKFFWILSSTPDSLVDSQGDSQDRQDRQDKDSVVCLVCLAGAPENHQHSNNQSRPSCERCGRDLLAPLSIERGLCDSCSPGAGRTSEQERQLDQAINGKAKQCAAPCGDALGTLNITNGDLVHENCRCTFGDCRAPLLDSESWQRKVCAECMADPKKKTDKLKIRSLP